ncbi:hypothetical protein MLD38_031624 [Melastoma candidum]|uniref:Uncharacterized protein n=1 Tax=Melastoma candidum TaxID=119954 RepID=A0ACB9MTL3_9MYRT|nr:hypothetical protein MLD38_031624 [Melastoma candidum]
MASLILLLSEFLRPSDADGAVAATLPPPSPPPSHSGYPPSSCAAVAANANRSVIRRKCPPRFDGLTTTDADLLAVAPRVCVDMLVWP